MRRILFVFIFMMALTGALLAQTPAHSAAAPNSARDSGEDFNIIIALAGRNAPPLEITDGTDEIEDLEIRAIAGANNEETITIVSTHDGEMTLTIQMSDEIHFEIKSVTGDGTITDSNGVWTIAGLEDEEEIEITIQFSPIDTGIYNEALQIIVIELDGEPENMSLDFDVIGIGLTPFTVTVGGQNAFPGYDHIITPAVPVGDTQTINIVVTNPTSGGPSSIVFTISLDDNDNSYSLADNQEMTISLTNVSGGNTATIPVTYKPPLLTTTNQTLTGEFKIVITEIEGSAPTASLGLNIPISGTSAVPFTTTPADIEDIENPFVDAQGDISNVFVGQTVYSGGSSTPLLVITNERQYESLVFDYKFEPAFAGEFVLTTANSNTPFSGQIDPNSLQNFWVQFTPLAMMQYETTLILTLMDGNTPLTGFDPIEIPLAVRGYRPLYSVSKTEIYFGDVFVGRTKMDSFVITNPTSDEITAAANTLVPFGLYVYDSVNNEFANFGANARPIAAGESLEVFVRYVPSAATTNTGNINLTVTVDSAANNHTIALSGTGTPAFTVSTADLDFGTYELNAAGTAYIGFPSVAALNWTKEFTIENNTGEEMTLKFEFTGADATNYSVLIDDEDYVDDIEITFTDEITVIITLINNPVLSEDTYEATLNFEEVDLIAGITPNEGTVTVTAEVVENQNSVPTIYTAISPGVRVATIPSTAIVSTTPTFSWTFANTGAEISSIQFMIQEEPFTAGTWLTYHLEDSTINELTFPIKDYHPTAPIADLTELTPGQSYRWTVRLRNSAGFVDTSANGGIHPYFTVNTTNPTQPTYFAVNPTTPIAFPNTSIDRIATQTLTISNLKDSDPADFVDFTIGFLAQSEGFRFTTSKPVESGENYYRLTDDETLTVTIIFDPLVATTYSANLVITQTSDLVAPLQAPSVNIALSGTGTPAYQWLPATRLGVQSLFYAQARVDWLVPENINPDNDADILGYRVYWREDNASWDIANSTDFGDFFGNDTDLQNIALYDATTAQTAGLTGDDPIGSTRLGVFLDLDPETEYFFQVTVLYEDPDNRVRSMPIFIEGIGESTPTSTASVETKALFVVSESALTFNQDLFNDEWGIANPGTLAINSDFHLEAFEYQEFTITNQLYGTLNINLSLGTNPLFRISQAILNHTDFDYDVATGVMIIPSGQVVTVRTRPIPFGRSTTAGPVAGTLTIADTANPARITAQTVVHNATALQAPFLTPVGHSIDMGRRVVGQPFTNQTAVAITNTSDSNTVTPTLAFVSSDNNIDPVTAPFGSIVLEPTPIAISSSSDVSVTFTPPAVPDGTLAVTYNQRLRLQRTDTPAYTRYVPITGTAVRPFITYPAETEFGIIYSDATNVANESISPTLSYRQIVIPGNQLDAGNANVRLSIVPDTAPFRFIVSDNAVSSVQINGLQSDQSINSLVRYMPTGNVEPHTATIQAEVSITGQTTQVHTFTVTGTYALPPFGFRTNASGYQYTHDFPVTNIDLPSNPAISQEIRIINGTAAAINADLGFADPDASAFRIYTRTGATPAEYEYFPLDFSTSQSINIPVAGTALYVEFLPTALREYEANLLLTHPSLNHPGNSAYRRVFNLKGEGGIPLFTLSGITNNLIDFGTHYTDDFADDHIIYRAFDITNNTGSPLTIDLAAIDSGAVLYLVGTTLANTHSITIEPYQLATVTLAFAPNTAAAVDAQLTGTASQTGATDQTFAINIAANAIAPNFILEDVIAELELTLDADAEVDFEVELSATGAAIDLVLTQGGANIALFEFFLGVHGNTAIEFDDPIVFDIDNQATITLGDDTTDEFENIMIVFTPANNTVAGTYTAWLKIEQDDPQITDRPYTKTIQITATVSNPDAPRALTQAEMVMRDGAGNAIGGLPNRVPVLPYPIFSWDGYTLQPYSHVDEFHLYLINMELNEPWGDTPTAIIPAYVDGNPNIVTRYQQPTELFYNTRYRWVLIPYSLKSGSLPFNQHPEAIFTTDFEPHILVLKDHDDEDVLDYDDTIDGVDYYTLDLGTDLQPGITTRTTFELFNPSYTESRWIHIDMEGADIDLFSIDTFIYGRNTLPITIELPFRSILEIAVFFTPVDHNNPDANLIVIVADEHGSPLGNSLSISFLTDVLDPVWTAAWENVNLNGLFRHYVYPEWVTDPISQSFVIANPGTDPVSLSIVDDFGSEYFTVSVPTALGANLNEFTGIWTLDPNGIMTYTVSFLSPVVGNFTRTFTITEIGTTSPPRRVTMTGQAIMPPFAVNTENINFGVHLEDEAPLVETFIITNPGAAAIELDLTLIGGNPALLTLFDITTGIPGTEINLSLPYAVPGINTPGNNVRTIEIRLDREIALDSSEIPDLNIKHIPAVPGNPQNMPTPFEITITIEGNVVGEQLNLPTAPVITRPAIDAVTGIYPIFTWQADNTNTQPTVRYLEIYTAAPPDLPTLPAVGIIHARIPLTPNSTTFHYDEEIAAQYGMLQWGADLLYQPYWARLRVTNTSIENPLLTNAAHWTFSEVRPFQVMLMPERQLNPANITPLAFLDRALTDTRPLDEYRETITLTPRTGPSFPPPTVAAPVLAKLEFLGDANIFNIVSPQPNNDGYFVFNSANAVEFIFTFNPREVKSYNTHLRITEFAVSPDKDEYYSHAFMRDIPVFAQAIDHVLTFNDDLNFIAMQNIVHDFGRVAFERTRTYTLEISNLNNYVVWIEDPIFNSGTHITQVNGLTVDYFDENQGDLTATDGLRELAPGDVFKLLVTFAPESPTRYYQASIQINEHLMYHQIEALNRKKQEYVTRFYGEGVNVLFNVDAEYLLSDLAPHPAADSNDDDVFILGNPPSEGSFTLSLGSASGDSSVFVDIDPQSSLHPAFTLWLDADHTEPIENPVQIPGLNAPPVEIFVKFNPLVIGFYDFDLLIIQHLFPPDINAGIIAFDESIQFTIEVVEPLLPWEITELIVPAHDPNAFTTPNADISRNPEFSWAAYGNHSDFTDFGVRRPIDVIRIEYRLYSQGWQSWTELVSIDRENLEDLFDDGFIGFDLGANNTNNDEDLVWVNSYQHDDDFLNHSSIYQWRIVTINRTGDTNTEPNTFVTEPEGAVDITWTEAPNALNFGTQHIDFQTVRTFTITNPASTARSLTFQLARGADREHFNLTALGMSQGPSSTYTISVPAGATRVVTMTFAPRGVRSGTDVDLNYTIDNGTTTFNIPITFNGIDRLFTVTQPEQFERYVDATDPVIETFRIRNPHEQDVNVTIHVAFDENPDHAFEFASEYPNGAPFDIGNGQFTMMATSGGNDFYIPISFIADVTGLYNATITVTEVFGNDPPDRDPRVLTVELNGRVYPDVVFVNVEEIDFGTVIVGTYFEGIQRKDLDFTVRNNYNEPLPVTFGLNNIPTGMSIYRYDATQDIEWILITNNAPRVIPANSTIQFQARMATNAVIAQPANANFTIRYLVNRTFDDQDIVVPIKGEVINWGAVTDYNLIYPALQDVTDIGLRPTFLWDFNAGGTAVAVHFHLRLAADIYNPEPEWSYDLQGETALPTQTKTWKLDVDLLPDTEYIWGISAGDGVNWGPFSGWQAFTTRGHQDLFTIVPPLVTTYDPDDIDQEFPIYTGLDFGNVILNENIIPLSFYLNVPFAYRDWPIAVEIFGDVAHFNFTVVTIPSSTFPLAGWTSTRQHAVETVRVDYIPLYEGQHKAYIEFIYNLDSDNDINQRQLYAVEGSTLTMPLPVTLILPEDEATITSMAPRFTWEINMFCEYREGIIFRIWDGPDSTDEYYDLILDRNASHYDFVEADFELYLHALKLLHSTPAEDREYRWTVIPFRTIDGVRFGPYGEIIYDDQHPQYDPSTPIDRTFFTPTIFTVMPPSHESGIEDFLRVVAPVDKIDGEYKEYVVSNYDYAPLPVRFTVTGMLEMFSLDQVVGNVLTPIANNDTFNIPFGSYLRYRVTYHPTDIGLHQLNVGVIHPLTGTPTMSATRVFRGQAIGDPTDPPLPATLVSPIGVNIPVAPTFVWTLPAQPLGHEIESIKFVLTRPDLPDFEVILPHTDTEYELAFLLAYDTEYEWTVTMQNRIGEAEINPLTFNTKEEPGPWFALERIDSHIFEDTFIGETDFFLFDITNLYGERIEVIIEMTGPGFTVDIPVANRVPGRPDLITIGANQTVRNLRAIFQPNANRWFDENITFTNYCDTDFDPGDVRQDESFRFQGQGLFDGDAFKLSHEYLTMGQGIYEIGHVPTAVADRREIFTVTNNTGSPIDINIIRTPGSVFTLQRQDENGIWTAMPAVLTVGELPVNIRAEYPANIAVGEYLEELVFDYIPVIGSGLDPLTITLPISITIIPEIMQRPGNVVNMIPHNDPYNQYPERDLIVEFGWEVLTGGAVMNLEIQFLTEDFTEIVRIPLNPIDTQVGPTPTGIQYRWTNEDYPNLFAWEGDYVWRIRASNRLNTNTPPNDGWSQYSVFYIDVRRLIDVEPLALDFPAIEAFDSTDLTFTVFSLIAPERVDLDFTFDGDDVWEVTFGGTTQIPASGREFRLTFTPEEDKFYEGELIITANRNRPGNTYVVRIPLTGQGVEEIYYTPAVIVDLEASYTQIALDWTVEDSDDHGPLTGFEFVLTWLEEGEDPITHLPVMLEIEGRITLTDLVALYDEDEELYSYTLEQVTVNRGTELIPDLQTYLLTVETDYDIALRVRYDSVHGTGTSWSQFVYEKTTTLPVPVMFTFYPTNLETIFYGPEPNLIGVDVTNRPFRIDNTHQHISDARIVVSMGFEEYGWTTTYTGPYKIYWFTGINQLNPEGYTEILPGVQVPGGPPVRPGEFQIAIPENGSVEMRLAFAPSHQTNHEGPQDDTLLFEVEYPVANQSLPLFTREVDLVGARGMIQATTVPQKVFMHSPGHTSNGNPLLPTFTWWGTVGFNPEQFFAPNPTDPHLLAEPTDDWIDHYEDGNRIRNIDRLEIIIWDPEQMSIFGGTLTQPLGHPIHVDSLYFELPEEFELLPDLTYTWTVKARNNIGWSAEDIKMFTTGADKQFYIEEAVEPIALWQDELDAWLELEPGDRGPRPIYPYNFYADPNTGEPYIGHENYHYGFIFGNNTNNQIEFGYEMSHPFTLINDRPVNGNSDIKVQIRMLNMNLSQGPGQRDNFNFAQFMGVDAGGEEIIIIHELDQDYMEITVVDQVTLRAIYKPADNVAGMQEAIMEITFVVPDDMIVPPTYKPFFNHIHLRGHSKVQQVYPAVTGLNDMPLGFYESQLHWNAFASNEIFNPALNGWVVYYQEMDADEFEELLEDLDIELVDLADSINEPKFIELRDSFENRVEVRFTNPTIANNQYNRRMVIPELDPDKTYTFFVTALYQYLANPSEFKESRTISNVLHSAPAKPFTADSHFTQADFDANDEDELFFDFGVITFEPASRTEFYNPTPELPDHFIIELYNNFQNGSMVTPNISNVTWNATNSVYRTMPIEATLEGTGIAGYTLYQWGDTGEPIVTIPPTTPPFTRYDWVPLTAANSTVIIYRDLSSQPTLPNNHPQIDDDHFWNQIKVAFEPEVSGRYEADVVLEYSPAYLTILQDIEYVYTRKIALDARGVVFGTDDEALTPAHAPVIVSPFGIDRPEPDDPTYDILPDFVWTLHQDILDGKIQLTEYVINIFKDTNVIVPVETIRLYAVEDLIETYRLLSEDLQNHNNAQPPFFGNTLDPGTVYMWNITIWSGLEGNKSSATSENHFFKTRDYETFVLIDEDDELVREIDLGIHDLDEYISKTYRLLNHGAADIIVDISFINDYADITIEIEGGEPFTRAAGRNTPLATLIVEPGLAPNGDIDDDKVVFITFNFNPKFIYDYNSLLDIISFVMDEVPPVYPETEPTFVRRDVYDAQISVLAEGYAEIGELIAVYPLDGDTDVAPQPTFEWEYPEIGAGHIVSMVIMVKSSDGQIDFFENVINGNTTTEYLWPSNADPDRHPYGSENRWWLMPFVAGPKGPSIYMDAAITEIDYTVRSAPLPVVQTTPPVPPATNATLRPAFNWAYQNQADELLATQHVWTIYAATGTEPVRPPVTIDRTGNNPPAMTHTIPATVPMLEYNTTYRWQIATTYEGLPAPVLSAFFTFATAPIPPSQLAFATTPPFPAPPAAKLIDFGWVDATGPLPPATERTRTFTVTNGYTVTLPAGNVSYAISGTGASAFTVTPATIPALNANAASTVTVVFNPPIGVYVNYEATIQFTHTPLPGDHHSQAPATDVIVLRGNAYTTPESATTVEPLIATEGFEFGTIYLDDPIVENRTKTHRFVVTNNYPTDTIRITAITPIATDEPFSGVFVPAVTLPIDVTSLTNNTRNIDITFAPSVVGNWTGNDDIAFVVTYQLVKEYDTPPVNVVHALSGIARLAPVWSIKPPVLAQVQEEKIFTNAVILDWIRPANEMEPVLWSFDYELKAFDHSIYRTRIFSPLTIPNLDPPATGEDFLQRLRPETVYEVNMIARYLGDDDIAHLIQPPLTEEQLGAGVWDSIPAIRTFTTKSPFEIENGIYMANGREDDLILDFGTLTIPVPGVDIKPFSITNNSSEPIDIDMEYAFLTPEFTVVYVGAPDPAIIPETVVPLPQVVSIPGNGMIEVYVKFQPENEGNYNGEITLTTEIPYGDDGEIWIYTRSVILTGIASTIKYNPPLNFTVGTVTHNSIAVSWELPEPEEHLEVAFYNMYLNGAFVVSRPAGSFTHVFTDLIPFTMYNVEVRAVYSVEGEHRESPPGAAQDEAKTLGEPGVPFNLSPTLLTFEPVIIDETDPTTNTFIITNTTPDAISVTLATSSVDFVAPVGPHIVPVNQTLEIIVTFDPQTPGTKAATLTASLDDFSRSISLTGIAYEDLKPATLVAPEEGELEVDRLTMFVWDAPTDTSEEVIEYRLYLSTTIASLGTPATRIPLPTPTQTTHTLTTPLPYNTLHFWRIDVLYAGGTIIPAVPHFFTTIEEAAIPHPYPVTLDLPEAAATGVAMPVIFTWTLPVGGSPREALYLYVTDTEGVWGNAVVDLAPNATTYTWAGAEYSTTYFWRVVAGGPGGFSPSTERVFTTVDPLVAPLPAALVTPNHNATSVNIPVEFVWSLPTTGAPRTAINFYVTATQNVWGNPVALGPDITTYTYNDAQYETVYWWRVDTIGEAGTTASDVRQFTTVVPPPNPVALVFPADEAVYVDPNTNFTWEIDLPIGYHDAITFYISNNPDNMGTGYFVAPNEFTFDVVSKTGAPLLRGVTYYWQVIPSMEGLNAADNQKFSFTVAPEPFIATPIVLNWTPVSIDDMETRPLTVSNMTSDPINVTFEFNNDVFYVASTSINTAARGITNDNRSSNSGNTRGLDRESRNLSIPANAIATVNIAFAPEEVIPYNAILTVIHDRVVIPGHAPVWEAEVSLIGVGAPGPDPLIAPTNLQAQLQIQNVILSWNTVPQVPSLLGYMVYRFTAGTEYQVTSVPISNNNVLVPTVPIGTHQFRVRAAYAHGLSEPATRNVDVDAILPANNITHSLANQDVTLNWEAPIHPGPGTTFNGYKVFRNGIEITGNLLTALTFTDYNVPIGHYQYSVVVNYAGGDSDPLGHTVDVDIIQAPTNHTHTLDVNDVTLSWSAPVPLGNTFEEYEVFRGGVSIGFTRDLHFLVENQDYGVHTFRVRANYLGGNSGFADVRVPIDPLNAPDNLALDNVRDQEVILTWDRAQAGETFEGYVILRAEITNPAELVEVGMTSKNPDETFFVDVAPFGEFYYSVLARYFGGDSDATDEVLVTVDRMSPPRNFTGIQRGRNEAFLTWEEPLNVGSTHRGYRVYSMDDMTTPIADLARHHLSYSIPDMVDGFYTYFIEAVYEYGISDMMHTEVLIVVSTEEEPIVPIVTELLGNYPNPFNPDTNIQFNMSEAGLVTIEIYNVRGQRIRSLVNDQFDAGTHSVIWNGRDDNGREVSSGLYLYIMRTGDYHSVRRMTLMK